MYLCVPPRLFDGFFEVYFLLWRALYLPVLTCQDNLLTDRYCAVRVDFLEGCDYGHN
jgi:hypothetical protein